MTQTLLEIVQTVLEEIDGDTVNSITDTEESEQIAGFVKTVYRNIMSNNTWPHTRRAVTLTARSDSAFPSHMLVNEDVKEMISIRYNTIKNGETRKKYTLLTYKDPDEFLNILNRRDSTATNVDTIIDDSGIELLIMNDKAPQYYTSFDDENLIFDSYDSAVDSTLQANKFQAQGYVIPTFTLDDDFIPDLPIDAFSMLIEEVISRAQLKLRQVQDAKSEQESQRQRRSMSRKNWVVSGGIRYPNYGRNRTRMKSAMRNLPRDD